MNKDEAILILDELKDYILQTYNEHYSAGNKIQVVEFIMSQFDTGEDFLRGNVLKYTSRYGKKAGKNRKDLLKAIHYLLLMMHYEDVNENNPNQSVSK